MKLKFVLMSVLISVSLVAQAQPPEREYREPPSNDEVGVNVDRYIGNPAHATPGVAFDIVMTRTILGPGDPNANGTPGETLRYRRQIDLGEIHPGESSALTTSPDQQVFYIQSGTGRIDDGERYWDLYPGIALVIPPNQEFRIGATGSEPMNLLMLSYDRSNFPAMVELDGILVRDTNKILYTERNVHWNNFAKYIFNDIGERVYLVYLEGNTMAGPHAHSADDEEAWVKITDNEALMQLGSAIRPWPKNVGILAPTTGATVHAAINHSDSRAVWLYFARPPNEIRVRQGTPEAVRASSIEATVAGTRLR